MDLIALIGLSTSNPQRVTLETTVTTGFESVAFDECKEKFQNITEICRARGRLFFNVNISQIEEVLRMRSIDNVFVISHAVLNIGFPGTNIGDDIQILQNHAVCIDWLKVVSVWKNIVRFSGICYPTKEEYKEAVIVEQRLKEEVLTAYEAICPPGLPDKSNSNKCNVANSRTTVDDHELSDDEIVSTKAADKLAEMERTKQKAVRHKIYNELDIRIPVDKVLKYRVTCNRSGKHTFGSQDAAYHFGGAVQDMYNWVVDLEHFDLEVVLNVRHDFVYVSVSLTKESKHRRNINHFGPTTLRATICYNLVRLGEPKVGEVVVDPLAGGGSIPIEGVLAFPGTYHIGGDVHPKATARSLANLGDITDKTKCYMDLLAWDSKNLPLKDSSVDVFVSDLPFGKRSGSKWDNRSLYKKVLCELGRVVRKGSGRVVLLTQDRRSFLLALAHTRSMWKQSKTLGVNIGGLDAAVFVLRRTL